VNSKFGENTQTLLVHVLHSPIAFTLVTKANLQRPKKLHKKSNFSYDFTRFKLQPDVGTWRESNLPKSPKHVQFTKRANRTRLFPIYLSLWHLLFR